MSFRFPVSVLREETAAALLAAGVGTYDYGEHGGVQSVPHLEDERDKARLVRWPRYLWVYKGDRVDDKGQISHGPVRDIAPILHDFEVQCWGKTRDMAFAMGHNLLKAWNDLAQADIGFTKSSWTPSNATNADGYVYVVTGSLRSSTEDRFVDISTLPDAQDVSVIITSVEMQGYIEDGEGNQELALETSI